MTSNSVLGVASDKSGGMFNRMQMRSDFRRQRPIRLFGVVSDGLKIAGLWRRSVV